MNMKRKIFDLTLIISAAALLIFFGVGTLLPRDSDFSETENRMLATLKPPTVEQIADGSFSRDISAFYRDGLPHRVRLISLRTRSELFLLKGQSNGVIFAEDGYLLQKGEYDDLALAERNFEHLARIEDMCEDSGKPLVCAIAPRGIDVMSHRLPKTYGAGYKEIWQYAEGLTVEYTDLTPPLKSAAESGEYVWYRTDHHWTTEGAYIAYAALSEKLGYIPAPADSFTPWEAEGDFFGSVYSLGGCIAPIGDKVELYRYNGDGDYIFEISESGETTEGFYFFDRLSVKDKYSVFLGGNYAECSLRKVGTEKRERLLLIKDSYANAIVPFLAIHYDIELVDLRYFEGGEKALEEKICRADRVLLLHGIDTIATTPLY